MENVKEQGPFLEPRQRARWARRRIPGYFGLSVLKVLVATLCIALTACAMDPGQDARFGAYGGARRDRGPTAAFDIASTSFGVRWFPTHLRWAPDGSHLLVSLCHVKQVDYCRIGKYWLAERRWELLALKPHTTYRWPSYSPDGKRIVVTVGPCDEKFACSASGFVLTLIDPSGGNSVDLVRSIAQKPSFSDDGRKIIYWRHTGGGASDVAMYDLNAAKEEKLTALGIWDNNTQTGPPFFLSGGQRFTFSGNVHLNAPIKGTRLDPKGPNQGLIRYVWDRRHGLLTLQRYAEVDLLWPDGDLAPITNGSLDVSRAGEILYLLPYQSTYTNQLKSGRYKGNVIANVGDKDILLVLRPALEDAPFSAVFRIPHGAQFAAISPDGQRIAFGSNNPRIWGPQGRLSLVSLSDQSVELIDWPTLELDPAAVQTN